MHTKFDINVFINTKWAIYEMIIMFILYSTNKLNIYSASLLKQQSSGTDVAPLGHIILILS
jgi:hypothetical protein